MNPATLYALFLGNTGLLLLSIGILTPEPPDFRGSPDEKATALGWTGFTISLLLFILLTHSC